MMRRCRKAVVLCLCASTARHMVGEVSSRSADEGLRLACNGEGAVVSTFLRPLLPPCRLCPTIRTVTRGPFAGPSPFNQAATRARI
jgi:hypothetical protein